MDDNKIDSLTVDVGLDTSGFKRGQQELDAGLDEIEKGADSAAESVDGLGNAAREAGEEVEGFGGKSKDAAADVDGLSSSSSEASEKVGRLRESSGDAGDEIERLGEAAEDSGGSLDELGSASERASDSLDDVSHSTDDATSKIKNLDQAGQKTGRQFGAHFEQMTRSVRGLANELLGVAALTGGGIGLGAATVGSVSSQADTGRKATMIGMKPRDLKGWENTSEAFGGTAQEVDGFLQKIADIPTANIISGEGIPQWLMASGIDLSDGKGGRKDINEVGIEIMDWLNKQDEQKRSYIIRNYLGGGQGLDALSGLGGDVLRSELQKGANRSGMTEEGVQRTQELQKKMAESMQEMQGAWNKFISDNAPKLTEAIKGITSEFERFGKEITEGLKKFDEFQKESGGATNTYGTATNYIATKALSIFTGGDEKKAAEYNKWLNERASHLKQSNDGFLYNPNDLPDRPDDPLPKKGRWERVQIWDRQRRREDLRKRGQSTDVPGLKETEASDNDLWQKSQAAIDWTNKRIDEIEKRGFQAVYPDHIPGESVEEMKQRMSTQAPASPATQIGTPQRKLPPELAEMQGRLAELEKQYGLPEGWMTKTAMKESSGNPNAVSRDPKTGKPVARGMYQFTPDSAVTWGVSDPFDKWQSAEGSARFFGAMFQKFNGDPDKASAAYHSGPARVERLVAEHGDQWRDGLGEKGAGYINHPYKPKAKRNNSNAQQLAEAASVGDLTAEQISNLKTPYQLGPHLSPGVQNALNSQDNRSTTSNSTRIDQINVNMTGGNAQDVSNNIGSVLQRHPFLNGANYA